MKNNPVISFVVLFLFSSLILSQPSINDYQTVKDGSWSDVNIWEIWNGSAWITPLAPPTASTANVITIREEHRVAVDIDVDADQLVITTKAFLAVDVGITLSIVNGSGTDLLNYGILDIKGTLKNSGQLLFDLASENNIKTGAVYQHSHLTVAGYIPAFTWFENSTCEIIGYTTYTGHMDVEPQTFRNVVWNCRKQENQVVLDSNFIGMLEDFTVISTGKDGVLCLSYGKEYIVNGKFRQEGGLLKLAYGMNGASINIKGDAEFVGGSILLGYFPGTAQIKMSGTVQRNLLIEDAYNFETGPSMGLDLIIQSSSIRNLQQNANIDGAYLRLYGTLICNEYVLSGTSLSGFVMYPGSTLNTASVDGICPEGVNFGSIRTSYRNYESDATYLYSRIGKQQSGTGIPDTVMKLGKINGYFVALEKDLTISDTLALDGGSISLYDKYNLSIFADAIITGTFSNNNMIIVEDLESYLTRYIDKGGAYLYPVGTENGVTYTYTPAYIKVDNGTFGPEARISVTLDDVKHKNNYSKYNFLTRYWLVRISDITDIMYFGRLTYDDIDIVGDENEIHLGYKVAGGEFVEGSLANTTTNELDIPEFIEEDCDFTGVDLSDVIIRLDLKVFLQGAYR